jgi:hypothetical protein
MGLGWPIMFRLLEYGGDFGLLLLNDAFRDHRLERPIIAVNPRWEPESNPEAVVGALRCASFKRRFSEGSEKSRYVQQISIRDVIHPARYRVGGKGQNQSGNGMVDFGIAANGRDSRRYHIHRDVPVWSRSARVPEREITAEPVVGQIPLCRRSGG